MFASPAKIEQSIFFLRGHKVMLSPHLADLYRVTTKALIQAVRRNLRRFPADFMFQLTWIEVERLMPHVFLSPHSRSQSVTLKQGANIKYLPYAFTEQGIAMLSSVLRSERAVSANIQIMRAFVRLREVMASNANLARRLRALERKYDARFRVVFDAIRELMKPPEPHPRIGFHVRHAAPMR